MNGSVLLELGPWATVLVVILSFGWNAASRLSRMETKMDERHEEYQRRLLVLEKWRDRFVGPPETDRE